MIQGTIRKLIHLCSGTDFTSTHLVNAHNGVGYGYIESPDGDVFFNDSGLTNLRFDQLRQDMSVEYALEKNSYRRASSVTVDEMRTESPAPSMDAVDESSLESFPASDSPAHCIAIASDIRALIA